jgi:hypothetical protein
MSKQTAVTLLFHEFRALSEAMKKAGDEQSANLIDFLCERENVAKAMEKEQIADACNSQRNDYRGRPTYNKSGEQYYNETYGGGD